MNLLEHCPSHNTKCFYVWNGVSWCVAVYLVVALHIRVTKSQTAEALGMLFCTNLLLYTSVLQFCYGECCSAALNPFIAKEWSNNRSDSLATKGLSDIQCTQLITVI